jgi:hypothetical protein
MTHDPNSVLARSMDAIDTAHRRAMATFAVGWLATFAALVWFARMLGQSESLERALSAAVVAIVFAIFLGAYAVMLYVARMTKRILRAIDIAMTARPPGRED